MTAEDPRDDLESRRALYRERALPWGTKRFDRGDSPQRNPVERHDPFAEEICLPPYDYPLYSPAEREVYDHPAMQRLRRVAQLGGAAQVYPSAEHSRFPHSVGTVAAAAAMMDRVDQNVAKHARRPRPGATWTLGRQFSTEERLFVRLGALVHDVAHLPYGHTLEDELGLLDAHDTRAKIRTVSRITDFDPLGMTLSAEGQESGRLVAGPSLEKLVQSLYEDALSAITRRSDVTVMDVVLDLVAKDSPSKDGSRYIADRFRLQLCRELLVGSVAADVMDYLPRDQEASGVETGKYSTRLLGQLLPLTPPAGHERDTRLVIDLGDHRRMKADAATALRRLFESRFEMTQVVYRHPVKSSQAAMLDRTLGHFLASQTLSPREVAAIEDKAFRSFAGEDGMLKIIHEAVLAGIERQAKAGEDVKSRRAADLCVLELLQLIVLRRLHKVEFSLSPAHEEELFDGAVQQFAGRAGAVRRTRLAADLESDFALLPGDVVVYCSGPRPGLKNPDISLRLDGDAVPLGLDSDNVGLARRVQRAIGDDFKNQQLMFESLGRFEVLLSNAAIAQLEGFGLRSDFAYAAELALRRWMPDRHASRVQNLADKVNRELGRSLGRVADSEHRSGPSLPAVQYENGMPCLRSLGVALP